MNRNKTEPVTFKLDITSSNYEEVINLFDLLVEGDPALGSVRGELVKFFAQKLEEYEKKALSK